MKLKVMDTSENIIKEVEIEDKYVDDEYLFMRYINVFVGNNQNYYEKNYALRFFEDDECVYQLFYDDLWVKFNITKVLQKADDYWKRYLESLF